MIETQKLGEVLIIRKGKKADKVFDRPVDGALPYIQIDEVRGITPSLFALDPKAVEVTENDLCIVWDGANAGTVGYGVAGAIGSTVARMRLREPRRWDPRFLGRLLEGKFRELNDQAQARGATIPHVDKGKLEDIDFPAIDRDEQRRLAAILDNAGSILRKRERALALADDFLRSVFLDKFGDPVQDQSGILRQSLSELAQIDTGKTPPTNNPNNYGSEIPFVTPGDLGSKVEGTRRTISRAGMRHTKIVQNGATLVCCIGATIGKMGFLTHEAAFNQQINAVTWGAQIHPIFGYMGMTFLSEKIAKLGTSTTLPIINKSQFGKICFPVPDIALQRRYAALVTKTWESQRRMKAHSHEAADLFSSLSQRAFRGEL